MLDRDFDALVDAVAKRVIATLREEGHVGASTRRVSSITLPPKLAREWMLLSEALEETGMGRTAFMEKRKQGLFECRKYKQAVLVRRSNVDRYLNNLPVA